jgi:uncharacterized membrane protein YccF (DUF307 family)
MWAVALPIWLGAWMRIMALVLASALAVWVQGLPMALAVFLAAGYLIYLVGALVVPETKGQFT